MGIRQARLREAELRKETERKHLQIHTEPDKCSGLEKIITHLDHISHCKTASQLDGLSVRGLLIHGDPSGPAQRGGARQRDGE
jgi:hypothetical protein